MRPINRNEHPRRSSDRVKKGFNNYLEARDDLFNRLGKYCSYCEVELKLSLAVEHVRPKSHHPELLLDWENMLLACVNCNSIKGSKDINLEDYFWPHTDNTFLAFRYSEGGVVDVNPKLEGLQLTRAQNSLDLTGLQRRPGNDPARRDDRWINRKEAWEKATIALNRLRHIDNDDIRDQIIDTAISKGNWSCWMEVFSEDVDMLKRLIESFPGTCENCFDEEGQPISRQGGAL